MGQGSNSNFWSAGDEGVRVTVVRTSDYTAVTTPIDVTNKKPDGLGHFNKVCKLQYTNDAALSPSKSGYTYVNPIQSLPRIISSKSLGPSSVEEIKSYFTDEQVIRSIASLTGIDFDVLVSGDYRLLIEPVTYITFKGVKIAMTATEAALYDEQTGGAVRAVLPTAAFQNLPLAMFLEIPDLGYPAWTGPKTGVRSNREIKTALGLGTVRFKDTPSAPPDIEAYDYVYRVNTEVITAVTVSGGQSDPEKPVSVTFHIDGRKYRVSEVYYPQGESQLVWVRWTTPSTPQKMTIRVSVSGEGSAQDTIRANIVDMNKNPPPDPQANDRNDSFRMENSPRETPRTRREWSVWEPWWDEDWVWHSGDEDDDGYWCDHGRWEFDIDRYYADLRSNMAIRPDSKNPTASSGIIKSGYGVNLTLTCSVYTNQNSATTPAQTAVSYFSEFNYKTYWRLLEATTKGYSAVFEFQKNPYSTYNNRTHFTPLWYPDGSYTVYTVIADCWTPDGMLSQNEDKSLIIGGNLWQDWHIAPQSPR